VAFDWELGNDKGSAFCPWCVRLLVSSSPLLPVNSFDGLACLHRPVTNSAFRGVVTIVSFFVAIALLFPSVLSNFGPTTVHIFAVLYFSIFTLDANSLTLGNGEVSCECFESVSVRAHRTRVLFWWWRGKQDLARTTLLI
jgi:hypothetical protein